jgi:hypothetical protein
MKYIILTIWLFFAMVFAVNQSITCQSRFNVCSDFGCRIWCKIIGNGGGICVTVRENPVAECSCVCYKKEKNSKFITTDMEWRFLNESNIPDLDRTAIPYQDESKESIGIPENLPRSFWFSLSISIIAVFSVLTFILYLLRTPLHIFQHDTDTLLNT